MSKKYSALVWMIALVIFVFIFVFFMYTFLHEGGHALAGVLFGQTVTDFNVNFLTFDARVGLVGAVLTMAQQAVQSAAGAALPFAVWVVFMLCVPRKGSFIMETLKLLSSMVVINTLLPWIVIPFLFLLGKAPADDVTHVLIYSHLAPLLLAIFALVLYAGGWILFLAKIDGLRNEIMLYRSPSELEMKSGIRSAVPVMAGVMAVCAVIAVTLNLQAEKNSVYKYTPPAGYGMVVQVDLTTRPYFSEPIWQFTLNYPNIVGIFSVIDNIDTTYFDLSVAGPDEFKSTIIHGEGYKAIRDGGLWEQSLPAGTYQLMLTSNISPGIASVYFYMP